MSKLLDMFWHRGRQWKGENAEGMDARISIPGNMVNNHMTVI